MSTPRPLLVAVALGLGSLPAQRDLLAELKHPDARRRNVAARALHKNPAPYIDGLLAIWADRVNNLPEIRFEVSEGQWNTAVGLGGRGRRRGYETLEQTRRRLCGPDMKFVRTSRTLRGLHSAIAPARDPHLRLPWGSRELSGYALSAVPAKQAARVAVALLDGHRDGRTEAVRGQLLHSLQVLVSKAPAVLPRLWLHPRASMRMRRTWAYSRPEAQVLLLPWVDAASAQHRDLAARLLKAETFAGRAAAMDRLLEAFVDEGRERIRGAQGALLITLGRAMLPGLLQRIGAGTVEERGRCLALLAAMPAVAREQYAMLRRAAADKWPGVAIQALAALVAAELPPARRQELARQLVADVRGERGRVPIMDFFRLEALGKLGVPLQVETRNWLLQLAARPKDIPRCAGALSCLAAHGQLKQLEPAWLKALLWHREPLIQDSALEALPQLGPETLELLRSALVDINLFRTPVPQHKALAALDRYGPAAAPTFRAWLRHPHKLIQAAGYRGLLDEVYAGKHGAGFSALLSRVPDRVLKTKMLARYRRTGEGLSWLKTWMTKKIDWAVLEQLAGRAEVAHCAWFVEWALKDPSRMSVARRLGRVLAEDAGWAPRLFRMLEDPLAWRREVATEALLARARPLVSQNKILLRLLDELARPAAAEERSDEEVIDAHFARQSTLQLLSKLLVADPECLSRFAQVTSRGAPTLRRDLVVAYLRFADRLR